MARPKPPPRVVLTNSADECEAQFYEALQTGDLERLMALWSDDEDVVCVHPGGGRVIGPAAIRASFEAIFAQNPVPVQPEQVRRVQTHELAVHHLAERVTVLTPQGTQTAWALATNVYIKTVLGWRLVAHHASPGHLGEPPDTAGETPSTLH